MLCDNCKKREATIHIKEVHNGKCVSTNLCAECAKEKELSGTLGAFGFNLAEVIFNVGQQKGDAPENKKDGNSADEQKLSCPECGWNMKKIRESGGKLGCSQCYSVFADMVESALEQVQRSPVHNGKKPRNRSRSAAGIRVEMDRLREELAAAVSAEEYEKAAVCRDRINLLKSELDEREK